VQHTGPSTFPDIKEVLSRPQHQQIYIHNGDFVINATSTNKQLPWLNMTSEDVHAHNDPSSHYKDQYTRHDDIIESIVQCFVGANSRDTNAGPQQDESRQAAARMGKMQLPFVHLQTYI
jgi:hypothetical protein